MPRPKKRLREIRAEKLLRKHGDQELHRAFQTALGEVLEMVLGAKEATRNILVDQLEIFVKGVPQAIEALQDPTSVTLGYRTDHLQPQSWVHSPPSQWYGGSMHNERRRSPERQSSPPQRSVDTVAVSTEDPLDEVERAPPAKRQKHSRGPGKRTSESEFGEITLAISQTCTASDLTGIRHRFFRELVSTLNSTTDASVELAAEFTGFFFEEVMGRNCLDRLVRFCKGYRANPTVDFDMGAANRLNKLSLDTTLPFSIRKFYKTLHNVEVYRTHSAPLVQHLNQLISARQFSAQYRHIVNGLENSDPELVAYFTTNGVQLNGSSGNATVAMDYLVAHSKVNRAAFHNMHQRVKGIDNLVEQFGVGILPLLPPGSMNRLRRLGTSRIQPAFHLLRRHVTSFQPVCDLVKDYIYLPFVKGEERLPIMTDVLTTPGQNPLLDCLQEAIDNSYTTENIVDVEVWSLDRS